MICIHETPYATQSLNPYYKETDMARNDLSNHETASLDFNSKGSTATDSISFDGTSRILTFLLVALLGIVLAGPAPAGIVVGNPGDTVGNVDTDGDGVPDEVDNCSTVSNAGALACDTDMDGYGNACDADFNNDGVSDGLDFASPYFLSDFVAGTESGNVVNLAKGTDMNCDGAVDGVDFVPPYFLTGFGAGIPGPSGLSCAGMAPCPPPQEDGFSAGQFGDGQ